VSPPFTLAGRASCAGLRPGATDRALHSVARQTFPGHARMACWMPRSR